MFKQKVLHNIAFKDIEKVALETKTGEESIVQSVFLYLKSGKKISIAGMANNYNYQPYLVKIIRKILKEYKQPE